MTTVYQVAVIQPAPTIVTVNTPVTGTTFMVKVPQPAAVAVTGVSSAGPRGLPGPTGPPGHINDATATTKGVVALAGELAGTADLPELADAPITLTVLFRNAIA